MKKLESSLTNMVVVLVAVAIITGGLLAWINQITAAPIKQQQDLELANGIKSVMGVDNLKVVADDTIKKDFDGKEYTFVVHKANDAAGAFLGAAIESSALGFGDQVKVLVGFDAKGAVLGYTILQHAETPGLGAKADVWFQKDGKGNIIGKNIQEKPLAVTKDGGDIDARAFLKAVNQAYAVYAMQDTDAQSGATTQAKQ